MKTIIRLLQAWLVMLLLVSAAPAADWAKPTLTDTYTNFLSYIDARLDDLAVGFSGTELTNQPTGTIRWSSGTAKWERYDGALGWVDLPSTVGAKYSINVDMLEGYHATFDAANYTIPAIDNTGTFRPAQKLSLKRYVSGYREMQEIYSEAGMGMFLGTKTQPTVIGYGIRPAGSDDGYSVQLVNYGQAGWVTVSPYGLSRSIADNVYVGQYLTSASTSNYTIWDSGNDGADSGLDADKMDGKQWVTVASGSATVAAGIQTLATLRTGVTTGGGNMYRYTVRAAGITVVQGREAAINCAWLELATSPSSDLLKVLNYTGGSKEFFYTVEIWE